MTEIITPSALNCALRHEQKLGQNASIAMLKKYSYSRIATLFWYIFYTDLPRFRKPSTTRRAARKPNVAG